MTYHYLYSMYVHVNQPIEFYIHGQNSIKKRFKSADHSSPAWEGEQ